MIGGTFGSDAPALQLAGISKQFAGVVALRDVGLVVTVGTVHALLGENGAGKSTLMRIAYGMLPPDGGEVTLFGRPQPMLTVRDAVRTGVGMVHQHLSLVPTLTAAENLVLGGHGRYRAEEAEQLLRSVSASSGLSVPPRALARELSIVEQQRLEILKALARGARLLILDEPTAVLAPREIDDLLRWVRAFVDGGGSVVLVTHKLREALAVADKVTVLRRGRVVHVVGSHRTSEEELARAIFPETVDVPSATRVPTPGQPVAEAQSLAVDSVKVRRIRDASFTLSRHDIVGVAAIEGSGHRELLLALAGVALPSAGVLSLPRRIALIPADRGRDGLIPEFTLTENVALRGAGHRRGLVPWRAFASRTQALLMKFGILAPSVAVAARTLSGGNQQRLVVARELEDDVDLVIADNPTRGLDIRAASFVHERLRDAAARGAAVVVHSSDLDELFELATRVLVVFQGEVREVELDRDTVGRAMLGAA